MGHNPNFRNLLAGNVATVQRMSCVTLDGDAERSFPDLQSARVTEAIA
jgi:hypothetical protein